MIVTISETTSADFISRDCMLISANAQERIIERSKKPRAASPAGPIAERDNCSLDPCQLPARAIVLIIEACHLSVIAGLAKGPPAKGGRHAISSAAFYCQWAHPSAG